MYIDMQNKKNRATVQFLVLRSKLKMAIHGIGDRQPLTKVTSRFHLKFTGQEYNFRTYAEALDWVETVLVRDLGRKLPSHVSDSWGAE
jgi:hypothetical protein